MAKLSLTQLSKHIEDFAEVVRAGGWKVDISHARRVSPPVEDIVLVTIRFGKVRK